MKQYLTRLSAVSIISAFLWALIATLPAAADHPKHPFAEQTNQDGSVIFMPIIFKAPFEGTIDMVQFLNGDPILYEVQHSSGSQARHQTQRQSNSTTFFHTKGENVAEWEELWYDESFIYRGTDTSPGNGQFYTLRDPGVYGSKWAPRYWEVGDIYERNPLVTFYRKSDCGKDLEGTQLSYLKFDAYYERYKFNSGIELNDVIELSWRLTPDSDPIESYFYAAGYGLVGWGSNDRGLSYVSEIHSPGARPDNVRESIGCLNRSAAADFRLFGEEAIGPLPYWPGNHRR
ncbi:MAG: hypothetical protein QNJ45_26705 [Ardenticatenaceae bacterium]|nr:hypothetical protein [Ardenticatenaceae bacterium]